MTESVTRISLSELTKVRMTCSNCGLSTEANLAKAYKSMRDENCPECDSGMSGPLRKDSLVKLNAAITELLTFKDAEIQFVLEENSPSTRR